MKIALSLFALVAVAAPMLAAPVSPPRLVGEVYPDKKPNLWLGGAFFPGKGYRTDVQSKWALYPGVKWQLFGLNGAGPQIASDRDEKNDVPAGYIAPLRGDVAGEKPLIAISNASPADQPRRPQMQSLYLEDYQRVAASLLRSKGLNIQRAKLTQLMRVDLNGDDVRNSKWPGAENVRSRFEIL